MSQNKIYIPTDIVKTITNSLNQTDIDVIHMLNNTNSCAKEEFMQNYRLAKPNNEYANIDLSKVNNNLKELEELKDYIRNTKIDEEYKNMFIFLADYQTQKNQFVELNAKVNMQIDKGENYEKESNEHKRLNDILFGAVNPMTFWAILNDKLNKINVSSLSMQELKQYEEILEMIGIEPENAGKLFVPSDTVFEKFSTIIKEYYRYILDELPKENRTYTVYEVCELNNKLVSKYNKESEWKAIVEPDRVSAATYYEEKKILYPGNRTRGDYSLEDLIRIIMHEYGVHVMRSVPYDKCCLEMVASGIPGYGSFEEGLANAVEQAAVGKYSSSGYLHYLSIGFARLLNKNFRETYEIQIRLENLTGGVNNSRCFDSVQRAYRGTGVLANNKDLYYYEGSVKAWKYISEHIDNPDYLLDNLFLKGKSDPTSSKHMNMLGLIKQMEIME